MTDAGAVTEARSAAPLRGPHGEPTARSRRRAGGPWRGVLVGLAVVGAVAGLTSLLARRPALACPGGTELVEATSPAGREAWCAARDRAGGPIREGPYRAWYPGGGKKIDGAFAGGAKAGRWVFWHENGLPKEAGEFRGGKAEGRWTRWHANGATLDEGEYREGLRQGRWTSWYPSGRKEREGEYRDGREDGAWTWWNVRGDACAGDRPAGAGCGRAP